jgi:hypothetical protein
MFCHFFWGENKKKELAKKKVFSCMGKNEHLQALKSRRKIICNLKHWSMDIGMLIYSFAKVTDIDKLEILFPGINGYQDIGKFNVSWWSVNDNIMYKISAMSSFSIVYDITHLKDASKIHFLNLSSDYVQFYLSCLWTILRQMN